LPDEGLCGSAHVRKTLRRRELSKRVLLLLLLSCESEGIINHRPRPGRVRKVPLFPNDDERGLGLLLDPLVFASA